jgi:hypothetical protein
MWGIRPESKGEGQPQELRQARSDYMSVWRAAANIEQNKGLAVPNFPQHVAEHLKANRLNGVQALRRTWSAELVYSEVATGTMLTCVSNFR